MYKMFTVSLNESLGLILWQHLLSSEEVIVNSKDYKVLWIIYYIQYFPH